MNTRTVAYHHGDEVDVVTGSPIKQQSTLCVLNFSGNSLLSKLNQSKYNFDNNLQVSTRKAEVILAQLYVGHTPQATSSGLIPGRNEVHLPLQDGGH